MRRPAVALAGAALLAGCGGPSAEEVLSDTAANLERFRSGRLEARLEVRARGVPGGVVGFRLSGPFAFRGRGELPVARIAYTQIAGARRATAILTSTGRRAFVTADGTTYTLPPARVDRLRVGGSSLGSAAGEELRLGRWLREPELADGGRVGGAETDLVRAELDVASAVNGLLELSQRLGASGDGALPAVSGAGRRELERSVASSSVAVHTGEDDRLLRRLRLEVALRRPEDAGSAPALARFRGLRIVFVLAVDDPNSRVRVAAPRGALPPSALPGGG